jgi:PEGA domain
MRQLFVSLSVLFSFILINSFVSSASEPPVYYGPEKVAVTTDPQTARIYINGVLTGTGSVTVTVPKNDCVRVEVKLEGYIQETRTYCSKKGMSNPPNSDYIQLQPDESYTSSIQSDVANNEILLSVKRGKSREEAWKLIVATVLSKFDVLENNDEKSGYLRTAWVGQTFLKGNNTIRTRVIIKLSSEDPLAFKIKFISEESRRAGTPFSADEQYSPFGRILKKYDGFIDELTTKLAN